MKVSGQQVFLWPSHTLALGH